MALLDAFFNRGFRAAKCKTLLKLTIPRIKLLRNRKELQLKQMRKDIAKLLETGQEGTARIRVEHLIRENKIMDAHEIIELYCELISVRLPIIETQRECPLDLKEAISSLCFAAPRCSDLPELLQIQMMFSAKYGKEFVTAATELMPESGVNRQIIELLSVRAPPVHERLKLLKEIAEEHELDWDPTDTETEFMKRHEDLLNGANHFADAAQLPLPKAKYDGSFYSAFVDKPSDGKPMPETGSEFLNLPTVSPSTLHPNYTAESFPTVPTSSIPSEDSTTMPDRFSDRMRQQPSDGVSVPADFETSASSVKRRNESSLQSNSEGTISSSPFTETRDSVNINMIPLDPSNVDADSPFVVTPDEKRSEPASYGVTESSTDTSLHSHEKDFSNTFHDVINTPPLPQKEKIVDQEPLSRLSVGQSNSSIYKTRTVVANDLQDVLEAAQQAAETADHAAAAARLAATLAQAKIAELSDKHDDHVSDNGGKSVMSEDQSEKHLDNCSEPSYASDPPLEVQHKLSAALEYPCYDTLAEEDSSALGDRHNGYLSSHQPSRSTSMEDDPFSYPNLFSSQDQYGGADHSPRHN